MGAWIRNIEKDPETCEHEGPFHLEAFYDPACFLQIDRHRSQLEGYGFICEHCDTYVASQLPWSKKAKERIQKALKMSTSSSKKNLLAAK